MPPMHTVIARQPSESERRIIERSAKPSAASYGCIAFVFGVIPIFLLSALGGWIARNTYPHSVSIGRFIGALAGICVLLYMLVRFISFERRQRDRAKRDRRAPMVQDIEVRDPRVIEIDLINDNEPILAFAIGDGKILFLQGQWIREESIYGAPRIEGDPDDDFVNGLIAPYSFPSGSFTISRLPHSGRVLSIRVAGEYLRPEKSVEALRKEYEFGESELLDGNLDEIAEVLAREHSARRKAHR